MRPSTDEVLVGPPNSRSRRIARLRQRCARGKSAFRSNTDIRVLGCRIVLDVYSLNAFADKQEGSFCEKNQLNGFWLNDPYFGFVTSFKYDDEKVSLDKYTIVEENRQREIYNWLQYFSPESLKQEVDAAGLAIDGVYGDVAGNPHDAGATEFAVALKRP